MSARDEIAAQLDQVLLAQDEVEARVREARNALSAVQTESSALSTEAHRLRVALMVLDGADVGKPAIFGDANVLNTRRSQELRRGER